MNAENIKYLAIVAMYKALSATDKKEFNRMMARIKEEVLEPETLNSLGSHRSVDLSLSGLFEDVSEDTLKHVRLMVFNIFSYKHWEEATLYKSQTLRITLRLY